MPPSKPLKSGGKRLLGNLTKNVFLKKVQEARKTEGQSIMSFTFNKSRCRMLSKAEEVKENSKGIMYWMNRDCRVQDNWAMLFAQRLALKHKMPLYVCFFYKDTLSLYPTHRHFKFLIEGLKCVRDECKHLNLDFYLINSNPLEIPNIVKNNNIGCVVCEFFPLLKPRQWKDTLLENLPNDVPLVEVDAHNIVPAWVASTKQEIAARTIRTKITKKLPEYLTGFPLVCPHPHSGHLIVDNMVQDYDRVIGDFKSETPTEEVAWAVPGPEAGLEMLRSFITQRLKLYDESRNDPSKNAVSNLSPWLHFGHISAQRCALEVKNLNDHKSQTESFLEELIVRRELADNYCLYNPNYYNIDGADAWAKKTLSEHRKDKRAYVYSREQFQKGETHDGIWNCAQFQLVQEGKMHGYMRMYWCKKILEWTQSPDEAIEIALWLNDTFSLDGSDPNGFVGVMWSICGIHDHPWKERDIFGKVRYMVDSGLKKKFDIEAYCARYEPQIASGSDTVQTSKRRKLTKN